MPRRILIGVRLLKVRFGSHPWRTAELNSGFWGIVWGAFVLMHQEAIVGTAYKFLGQSPVLWCLPAIIFGVFQMIVAMLNLTICRYFGALFMLFFWGTCGAGTYTALHIAPTFVPYAALSMADLIVIFKLI